MSQSEKGGSSARRGASSPHPRDGRNRLLLSMAAADLDRFGSALEAIKLLRGRILYQPGDTADWLYFPESALLSVSTRLRGGAWVETNVIGREGAIGLLEASARGVMASHVRVHAGGDAWRTQAASYHDAAAQSGELLSAARRHAEGVIAELRQAVICNTHHNLDQRFCRWVLERQDQLGGDSLGVTRACLADLLGAQRTSISETAGRLQKRGLIRSGRGTIFVLDREGLEAGACECRETIAEARRLDNAVGPHLKPTQSSHRASLPLVV